MHRRPFGNERAFFLFLATAGVGCEPMPVRATEALLALAAHPLPKPGALELIGDDPVFPTRFRIGAAGAAAIAACALAADELWAMRTGRRQRISVDVRHAAAALRSARYLRIDGKAPPNPESETTTNAVNSSESEGRIACTGDALERDDIR